MQSGNLLAKPRYVVCRRFSRAFLPPSRVLRRGQTEPPPAQRESVSILTEGREGVEEFFCSL